MLQVTPIIKIVKNRNKFAPRALCLSPWQDHGVLRLRKQKTARYADFKNTIYNAPRDKPRGIASLKDTKSLSIK